MTKSDAVKIFGKTLENLANAVGISKSAVSQWPDQLTRRQANEVNGAALRLGKKPILPANE